MKKERFPLELLVPQVGTMSWNDFGASIDIPLEPFELPHIGKVETRIRIDCLPIEGCDAASLVGHSYQFPLDQDAVNPEGGIYIEHAHHPVDLIALAFRSADEDSIEAHLVVNFAFDFEGLTDREDREYDDIGWQFVTRLVVRSPRFEIALRDRRLARRRRAARNR